jgi:hypothetical protein
MVECITQIEQIEARVKRQGPLIPQPQPQPPQEEQMNEEEQQQEEGEEYMLLILVHWIDILSKIKLMKVDNDVLSRHPILFSSYLSSECI